jgi:hypothetical protein
MTYSDAYKYKIWRLNSQSQDGNLRMLVTCGVRMF